MKKEVNFKVGTVMCVMDIHPSKTVYRTVDGMKVTRSLSGFLDNFTLTAIERRKKYEWLRETLVIGLQSLVTEFANQGFLVRVLAATQTGLKVSFVEVQCQADDCNALCSWDASELKPLDEAVIDCLDSNEWSAENVFCPCCQEKSDLIDKQEAQAEAQAERALEAAEYGEG